MSGIENKTTALSNSMVALTAERSVAGSWEEQVSGALLDSYAENLALGSANELGLPGWLPSVESAAILACVRSAGKGDFTGAAYAEVLRRAELRCQTVFDVVAMNVPEKHASAVYSAVVGRFEQETGLRSDFVKQVSELAVVVGLTSGSSGLPRVDELQPVVRTALALKAVGHNVVVAMPSTDEFPVAQAALHDEYRVVPVSVYRELMRTSTKVIGTSVYVSVSRSTDGVYRLVREFDCTDCYSVSSLPVGKYLLPGGFGRLVNETFMGGTLESVLALPALKASRGFCYLDVLPPTIRMKAAVILGRDPSVVNIVNFFPETCDWCADEAVLKQTGFAGDCPSYHVVTAGTLPPGLPGLARVGTEDRYTSDLSRKTNRMLDDLFSGVGAGSSGIIPNAPPADVSQFMSKGSLPLVPSDSSASLAHKPLPKVSSSHALAAPPVINRHGRSVSDSGLMMSNRVILDMGTAVALRPTWQEVDNPRVHMWVSRLGEGAPIDPRHLLDLSKVRSSADLPAPPASVSGVSVSVRPTGAMRSDGGKLVEWSRRSIPLPGCFMESVKLSSSKGKRFLCVHPSRGVICRYDLAFDHTVIVNGSLNVASVDSVLWLHGDLSLHVVGSGILTRVWFDDGMPGLGAMVTSMVFSFQATAIRRYGGEIHAERVIGLELRSVDTTAGLVKFHKRFKMRPNVEKVHLYAFDDVVAEPVLLLVQATGLRYIVVHDVRVPADSCQASVVVLDAQTTVKICVDSSYQSATVDAQMLFIRESKRYSACAGHDVAEARITGKGPSRLFIES